jgi:hypothetical protein
MQAWRVAERVIERWGRLVPLVLGAAWLVAFWLRFPHNYTISDPWQYASYAHRITAGTYFDPARAPGVFDQRFGVLLPVALVYALFGVSPHTTTLVPLLAGLAILVVIWRVLPKAAALPGVICALTCVPFLRGTTELFPDLIAAAYMMVSLLMLSQRLDAPEKRSMQLLRAGVGVSSWFGGMLAKETAYWVLPIWAGALLIDALRRRGPVLKWFHAPALLFALLLLSAYLWFCAHFLGDAFSRLHSIEHLAGRHSWSIRTPAALSLRLTSGAARFFWQQYGLLLLAVVPGLLVLPAKLRIWGAYTVVSVLAYWFGSTSLSSYQPLPLSWRMSLPCVPGFCIAGAYFLYWLPGRLKRLRAPARVTLIGFVSALLAVAMAPRVRAEERTWREYPDLEAMARVRTEVENHPEAMYLLISAERRTNQYVAASFGFSPPANARWLYAGALDAQLLATADVALLIVDPRHQNPHDRERSLARQVIALRLHPLFRRGSVRVFETKDLGRLRSLRSRGK